jgi:hypothetical protein
MSSYSDCRAILYYIKKEQLVQLEVRLVFRENGSSNKDSSSAYTESH